MDFSKYFISLVIPVFSFYFSKKIALLDLPNKSVKKHKSPVPYIGGVSFLILSLFYTLIYGFNLPVLLISLISLIGTFDDKYNFKPYLRLILEFVLCGLLVVCILPGINFLLALFLVFLGVTLINAFNFIDVKDGIMTSYVICLLLFFLNIRFIDISFLNFISMYIFSLLTIYAFNSEPAKAYQGDGGAYSAAAITFVTILNILNSYELGINKFIIQDFVPNNFLSLTEESIILFCIILSIFPILFEITFVIFVRLKNNANPLLASNDHIVLRFYKRGYSTYKISFIFMILPLLSNLIITFLNLQLNNITLVLSPIFLIIFCYKFLLLL